MSLYLDNANRLIDAARSDISLIKPSEWAEKNRYMTSDVSPFEGAFSFDRTPYLREVLDCLAPDHPARWIAVMKASQIGFSTGVIENGIGWIIAQNPGNTLFLAGDKELAKEAITGKIDQMIDSCGIRDLIGPTVLRKKNQRTGDTNQGKEFPGGRLLARSTQNLAASMRQLSMRFGFIDDFEAAPHSDKKAGSSMSLIETRFAAYYEIMKLYLISTPEVKQTSNIEPAFLLGDQRYYHVPCPCCGAMIPLKWKVKLKDSKDMAGIYYEVDDNGRCVSDSVGYICQECRGFFTDRRKDEFVRDGQWIPTAKPSKEGYYSYHINALYAPHGMYDWEHYVRKWLSANPIDRPANVPELKTFLNTVLGQTWEERGETPKVLELAKNTRDYEVGQVPGELSLVDGNGPIMFLTCACDLNGKVEDARLDYEVVAWSQNGATYSIDHGSIGTFVPGEAKMKVKKVRDNWSYEHGVRNSVWPEFLKVLQKVYNFEIDVDGKKYKRAERCVISGVDVGFHSNYAWQFIDNQHNINLFGIKGKDREEKARALNMDTPTFKKSRQRDNSYLLDVNLIKDELAGHIKLRWTKSEGINQPDGFMNFPTPSGGKYTMKDFFLHYASEHKSTERNTKGEPTGTNWVKKNSAVQNHLWDCRVYNIALKDMFVSMLCESQGIKNGSWAECCRIILG